MTVCDHAHESCPVLPGARRTVVHAVSTTRRDWPPARGRRGGPAHYRRVRDEIRAFVATLPDGLLADLTEEVNR